MVIDTGNEIGFESSCWRREVNLQRKIKTMIVKIAVGVPLIESYDYLVPEVFQNRITTGIRVLVPLGNRDVIGVVVGHSRIAVVDNLREILDIVDYRPVFSQRMLGFTHWISRYYFCGWAEVLESAIPRGLKPRLKRVIVTAANSDQLQLPDQEEKALLSSLEGKPHTFLGSKSCKISAEKVSKWRKNGLFGFKTVLERKTLPEAFEEWLTLNTDHETSPKLRKGSKADLIITALNKRSKIRLKEIKKDFSNITPVIKKLIRQNLVSISQEPVQITTPAPNIRADSFKKLYPEQLSAFQQIQQTIQTGIFQTHFLFGVTGSGKTEVYLHAVKETLQQGKSALILIPEISLTPQAVERFQERFGGRIAVLHSGLSDRERAIEWWKIDTGQCDIVIGARSAIFAPLENIGLIVVDEEHDSSYKQQETPFYNARDAAVKLGSDMKATVILGSATPSIESFFNTKNGKYKLLELTRRANLKPLPTTRIISLKDEKRQKGVFYLSKVLVESLKNTLLAGKQTLVFLNRRGFASYLSCKSCELPYLCHNCSIAMTWHKTKKLLICHHCGSSQSYPRNCDSCGHPSFRMEGIGTQRVEQDLARLFPEGRFLRMDRDSIQKKGALEKNIELINNHAVDFVVGTQLISKGHDFKHIGLVCIVLADMSLNIPDFRSSERSFQLISQVSGRAGRDEQGEGVTLIQTYNPGHFAVRTAVENDYQAFFNEEIVLREALNNPPYTRLILLKISSSRPEQARKTAADLAGMINKNESDADFQLMGPIEAPIFKVNNRYYWQLLIKTAKPAVVKSMLKGIVTDRQRFKPVGATRLSVDVDPYMLL